VIGKAVDVYEKIGERAEAISWMREGLKKGITKDEFEDDPELKELRADKRYQELVQR
jgi:hypothetical protein